MVLHAEKGQLKGWGRGETGMRLRPLQINSLFLITPEPKKLMRPRAAGNGHLITSLMGNGRQNHKFSSEAVYFCIVLQLFIKVALKCVGVSVRIG